MSRRRHTYLENLSILIVLVLCDLFLPFLLVKLLSVRWQHPRQHTYRIQCNCKHGVKYETRITTYMGDVAQGLLRQDSNQKTLGSMADALVGQGEGQLFYPSESTPVQTCLCLTPLRVYNNTCTQICEHVKIPSCRKTKTVKEQASQLVVWSHKHCIH